MFGRNDFRAQGCRFSGQWVNPQFYSNSYSSTFGPSYLSFSSFKRHCRQWGFLQCMGLCSQVPLHLDQTHFLVDFYLVPIYRVDLVLGVQWLADLGEVLFEYKKLYMKFTYHGAQVPLQGMKSANLAGLWAVLLLILSPWAAEPFIVTLGLAILNR